MRIAQERRIVRARSAIGVRAGLDLVAVAKVAVSSEQTLFPIDNVFDDQRGPGGSCWIAADSGAQTMTIAFEAPQSLTAVVVESEQQGTVCTQEIALSVSADGGVTFAELGTRAFSFSPYGPSFQSETWRVTDPAKALTHVRLRITPGAPAWRASLTSVVIH